MDSYALQAKEKVEEYKEVIADKAGELAGDVRDRSVKAGTVIRDKVANPLDTISEARAGFDSLFAAERVDRARESLETDAALAVGYKDQFLGAVKEAFGRVLKDQELTTAGHLQRTKGETEVRLQRAREEEKQFARLSAQFIEVLKRREALLSQLVHHSYRDQLRHVELPIEPSPKQLFFNSGAAGSEFKLRTVDRAPLLRDIRERRTMKPMVYVDVRERGLMRSIALTKADMPKGGIKARSNRLADLRWAIRHSDVQKLRSVPRASINDRSSPRLEGLTSAGRTVQAREVLEEVKQASKAELKHVETVDKSKPVIAMDKKETINEASWDRQSFLGEIRQGTELKHI
ncbi:WH2 motif domain containing protein [Acanthamoeba castellanii str. Neff]|uniref:WH2 motif domain containing protein n=1 Tax=Acanthamoeba castellanii (strain ATCC 30010 / Neff) TaxID=1257118 RepID=L8GPD7_ACACF|nr:WH2 motif domain containing protein [Acanthamoeba castellanii str. Neff]ELR14855.1 WH2 motif domain containing protein [Acanthamoeba castellanii str. Neff]